jgi:hypothetical protein
MSIYFLLIEVRFLTVVRSAFGSISDDFTSIKSASLRKKQRV